ncbi:hypothetical protein BGW41_003662 [Actinomortierella wolfii]|nr:hypothetical protein BGW41_003662 [Actinomortierella wolfii]
MDHILKLCSNLRFLEIDHEGDFEFSSELVNSKLAQLQFSHRVGVRLLRSALNHFRHLKSLTLVETQQDTIPVLIDALPSLPHLRDLGFLIDHIHVTDEPYAQLLAAGGSNRWRRIVLPRLGPETIDALANHADTLEYLDIDAADIRWNESLVDLLASFAQLQILRLTSYDIDASIFIDYIDDATDEYEEEEEQQQWWQQCRQLRPWKCENTLIEFKAHINGIPRNGIPLNHLNEEYPGESHDLQEQVLARLGRFHNLQCLELGLETISKEHRRVVKEYPEPQPLPYYDPDYQYECVDMTLENGLEMLHQLRQLRHLNVGHMATRIGPQEAEWMIEHWPRLRTIEGLCPSEEYMAISKFVELAPHIEVIEFLPMYDSD